MVNEKRNYLELKTCQTSPGIPNAIYVDPPILSKRLEIVNLNMGFFNYHKYSMFLIFCLLVNAHGLSAQSTIISFSGRSLDNGRELALDSIYIVNLTQNIDTTVYSGSAFDLGLLTGINEAVINRPELSVSLCFPSICETSTRFSVSSPVSGQMDLSVNSLQGKVYLQQSFNLAVGTNSFELKTDGLTPGIYFIRVLSGGMERGLRFIKSGASTGASCRILYQGGQELSSNSAKIGFASPTDLFRFTGFSQDCMEVTIDSVRPENGKEYWFRFTKGYPAEHDACDETRIWYDWTCYPIDYLGNWGLGAVEKEYAHHDKEYSWYIDQKNTGEHSANNCGPSSVTMAAMWSDSSFNLSSENARETYRPDGGWWYTNNIVDYLNLHSIPNSVVAFTDSTQIQQILRDGAVIILCLNTKHLRRTMAAETRADRFYGYADGHFLVVKGFREVDQNVFFETYDPNNWGMTYYDKTQKGKNRHYRASDITEAVSQWWNYLIVVYTKDGDPLKRMILEEVDYAEIKHQYGG